jgi:hypothetical protein
MDFAGYKYIAMGMVVLEMLVILLTYRRNPRVAFYTTIFSTVVEGQYLWVGRPLYAWQFASLFGLVFAGLSSRPNLLVPGGRSLSRFRIGMIVFFVYSFLVSIPMWTVFAIEGLGTSVTGVSIARVVTQTIYTLFVFGLFWLGLKAGRLVTTRDVLRMLVALATVVAYFAILQTVMRDLLGINIFPIIGSDDTIRSAFILGETFRATSFVGEPKHLGIMMSIGLSAFMLTRIFRIPLGRFWIHIPIAMATAVLLSLSTTGMYLSVAGLALTWTLFFRRARKIDLLIFTSIVSVALWHVLGRQDTYVNSLEQQATKLSFEVQDLSVLMALQSNPLLALLGTGLGNIHLFAVQYLPADFPLFRDGGYKANSGLFFVLGDSGLIGLLILLISPMHAVIGYLRERRKYAVAARNEALAALALLAVMFVSFLLRYNELYYLVAGFVYTRLATVRQNALANAGSARTTDALTGQGGAVASSIQSQPT